MPTTLELTIVAPDSNPASRLEPMLVRLPPQFAAELRNLARRTRVRQSDYPRGGRGPAREVRTASARAGTMSSTGPESEDATLTAPEP